MEATTATAAEIPAGLSARAATAYVRVMARTADAGYAEWFARSLDVEDTPQAVEDARIVRAEAR